MTWSTASNISPTLLSYNINKTKQQHTCSDDQTANTHGWMDGWMDEWMHGCMDAWMDAWIQSDE